jgi:hypothetical protein
MTNPTPVSPAAQAVLDAVTLKRWDVPHQACPKSIDQIKSDVAAALRAAADQVVPNHPKPSANSDYHLMNWTKSFDQYYQRQQTRTELLAIAAELEGAHD